MSPFLLYFSSLFLLLFFHIPTYNAENPLRVECNNTYNGITAANYTINNTFHTNLKILLPSLSSNVSLTKGFYNTSIGEGSDKVYGLVLCRGDVPPDTCRNCTNFASADLLSRCQSRSSAIWYDLCQVQYSDTNFFDFSTTKWWFWVWSEINMTDSEVEPFKNSRAQLMRDLANKIAHEPLRGMFATGKKSYSSTNNVFGLMQCKPVISGEACHKCLEVAITKIPECCDSRIGGRVVSEVCSLRFENNSFFGESLVGGPAPSPTLPPAPSLVGGPAPSPTLPPAPLLVGGPAPSPTLPPSSPASASLVQLMGFYYLALLLLLLLLCGDLQWNSLLQANFEAVPLSIPIIALAFVYQNVVPVLCTNLEGDLSKVRTAIIVGTAVPLALFLIWDAVILGNIPNLDMSGNKITDPLELLRSNNGIVGPIVEVFSFLAIATSYIGFVLGLTDFISDFLKLPTGQSKPLPYLLTLFPPLVLALLDPEIFFKALDFAGTYGVLVLFGILPAAMSWSEQYSGDTQSFKVPPLVPGGRFTLLLVMGGATGIILSEIVENFIRS